MDPRDIDLSLLASPNISDDDNMNPPPIFLLGDGTSCLNIWSKMDKHNIYQRICRGRLCHKDNGCINNKIILGPYEFSITLRKCKWYINRIDSLLNKYGRDYFDTYIYPAIIFVLGLTNYVEKVNPSLYRESLILLNLSGNKYL